MKANYRHFKQSSKGYSRNSSKGDLVRALWEEELEVADDAGSNLAGSLPRSAYLETVDTIDRVVLTRGDLRSGPDNRFAALRSWQNARADTEWQRVDDDSSGSIKGWFVRIWHRLLGR